jgi:hypothetical protein
MRFPQEGAIDIPLAPPHAEAGIPFAYEKKLRTRLKKKERIANATRSFH